MPETPPPITVTRHAEARIAQRYPEADPRRIRDQVIAAWEQREYILDEGMARILVPLPLGVAVLRDSLRGGGGQAVLTVVTQQMRHSSMSTGVWKRQKCARPPTPATVAVRQVLRARMPNGTTVRYKGQPESVRNREAELREHGAVWVTIEDVE